MLYDYIVLILSFLLLFGLSFECFLSGLYAWYIPPPSPYYQQNGLQGCLLPKPHHRPVCILQACLDEAQEAVFTCLLPLDTRQKVQQLCPWQWVSCTAVATGRLCIAQDCLPAATHWTALTCTIRRAFSKSVTPQHLWNQQFIRAKLCC
jgi:hypothetical protein